MSAFFVTATGTDIGKTFVTAGLIRHLRRLGHKVDAFKPVLSGFEMGGAAQSDAGQLLAALEHDVTLETLDRMAPWRFTAPLSPDMAAAHENRSIDFQALVSACRVKAADRYHTLFIEGVGGVMVPLDARHTVLDWMVELNIPIILVTGSYLGTISHTLTALSVLSVHNLNTRAVVVNETPGGVSMDETMSTIGRFAPGIPLCPLLRATRQDAVDEAMATLWRAIA